MHQLVNKNFERCRWNVLKPKNFVSSLPTRHLPAPSDLQFAKKSPFTAVGKCAARHSLPCSMRVLRLPNESVIYYVPLTRLNECVVILYVVEAVLLFHASCVRNVDVAGNEGDSFQGLGFCFRRHNRLGAKASDLEEPFKTQWLLHVPFRFNSLSRVRIRGTFKIFPESISEKYKRVQIFKLHFLQCIPLVQLYTSHSD